MLGGGDDRLDGLDVGGIKGADSKVAVFGLVEVVFGGHNLTITLVGGDEVEKFAETMAPFSPEAIEINGV